MYAYTWEHIHMYSFWPNVNYKKINCPINIRRRARTSWQDRFKEPKERNILSKIYLHSKLPPTAHFTLHTAHCTLHTALGQCNGAYFFSNLSAKRLVIVIHWVFVGFLLQKSQLSETTYPDLTVEQVTAVCSEICDSLTQKLKVMNISGNDSVSRIVWEKTDEVIQKLEV